MSFIAWIEEVTLLVNQPLLSLGSFHLTLGKIVGLAILLLITQAVVWIIDRGLKRLSHPDRHVVGVWGVTEQEMHLRK